MTRKKIVILEHSGGRLANQLWNYMAIFAYAKERGYEISNYSFTDYFPFFRIPTPNFLINILSIPWIKNNKLIILLRPYRRYINLIKKRAPECIVDSGLEEQFYLPPTPFKKEADRKKIEGFENGTEKILYFINWMFRNPVGIKKFRKEIVEYFRPTEKIEKNVQGFIGDLRNKHKHIVGVHIRQGDYKTFLSGALFFEQHDVRNILDQYLSFSGHSAAETVFVLCSDSQINDEKFAGLNTVHGLGSTVEDLFTLSKTDIILGSDSTFGAFASYYGNIPFIIFDRPMIDWEYYRGKTSYCENSKSRVVFY